MSIEAGATSVRLPVLVSTGNDGAEIVIDDVTSAVVEVWSDAGYLVSSTAITLVLTEDDTWASGNIQHVGEGLHFVSVPDAAVATAGVAALVKIQSTSQAIFGSAVPVVEAAVTADDIPTAEDTANAVRTELTNELGRLDVAVSSRVSSAGYGPQISGSFNLLTGLTSGSGTLADDANEAIAAAVAAESTIAAKLALITSGGVTITSPVAADGTTITVVQGDDYSNDDGRAITWTGTDADQWPDLTGATLEFTARMKGAADITAVPTVVTPTGTQVFRMELSSTDTDVTTGRYRYDVQATLDGGNVATLLNGAFVVQRTYTDAP